MYFWFKCSLFFLLTHVRYFHTTWNELISSPVYLVWFKNIMNTFIKHVKSSHFRKPSNTVKMQQSSWCKTVIINHLHHLPHKIKIVLLLLPDWYTLLGLEDPFNNYDIIGFVLFLFFPPLITYCVFKKQSTFL